MRRGAAHRNMARFMGFLLVSLWVARKLSIAVISLAVSVTCMEAHAQERMGKLLPSPYTPMWQCHKQCASAG